MFFHSALEQPTVEGIIADKKKQGIKIVGIASDGTILATGNNHYTGNNYY